MDSQEYERQLNDLENKLDRLRALYDQYFTGIERLEPLIPKKDLDRRIAALRRVKLRNTGLRFRTQMLIQKYTTYQTYWKRVARQIEEGTYRRDVMRARQRREQARTDRQSDKPGPKAYDVDLDNEMSMEDALFGSPEVDAALSSLAGGANAEPAPAPKPAPTGQPPPAAARQAAQRAAQPPRAKGSPPPVPGGGAKRPGSKAAANRPAPGDDAHLRAIYRKYMDARRANNERVDNVRYEKVADSIKKMLPKLQQKHKGKRIDFEVVLKNGKVGLKPVPKKE
jgi:hypothetical protein